MAEVPLEERVGRLLDQPDVDPETLLLLLSAGSLLGIVSLLGRWPQAAAGRPEARTPVLNFRPASVSGRREERRKGEGPVVRWGRRTALGETSCPAGEGIGEGGDVS